MVNHRQDAGLIFSPVRSVVSYEAKVIDESVASVFGKEPSLETDAAWHQLIKYNNLVVQKKDLELVDMSSVLLRDRSGYLASLSVMHQLHCLNYIREWAFPDYYIQEAGKGGKDHIFHCIDSLRKVIMCHSDITPRTFEWSHTDRHPVMKPRSTHECRNFDRIAEYAKTHAPSKAHGPVLENPELGPIFSEPVNKTQA